MPVINLPTAVKQDLIYEAVKLADKDAIFTVSAESISSDVTNKDTTYLDITGSGVLNHILFSNNASTPTGVVILVDGYNIISKLKSDLTTGLKQSFLKDMTVFLNVSFSTSLKITSVNNNGTIVPKIISYYLK